jgi:hypothetical protein
VIIEVNEVEIDWVDRLMDLKWKLVECVLKTNGRFNGINESIKS